MDGQHLESLSAARKPAVICHHASRSGLPLSGAQACEPVETMAGTSRNTCGFSEHHTPQRVDLFLVAIDAIDDDLPGLLRTEKLPN